MNDTSKVVSAAIGVIVTTFLLMVLADCTVVRKDEIVELELLGVSGGVIRDNEGLPRTVPTFNHPIRSQVCTGEKVRVLKTSGDIFGWFPMWYILEVAEDQ